MGDVRKPAVAGAFYPKDAEELRGDVERYLSEARGASETSNIIIAPHAGYIFSAPVAAFAYLCIPKDIKTVFIIGPSHKEWFDGVRLPGGRFYETPLGVVEVEENIVEKLCESSICSKAQNVDDGEHCIEVQLPFLQTLLDGFKIVPILTGKVDACALAELILPLLSDDTILVVSSDLSHYLPQDRARDTDDATLASILSGSADGFMDGCGETAMRAAIYIASKRGLTAKLLDARTSFETAPQYCDDNRVVGYAAVAFVKQDAGANNDGEITDTEKSYMLKLARETIANACGGRVTSAARPDDPALSRLLRNYGCFVTLHKHGLLRGCIGYIEPIMPLYKAVADNAVSAAFHDPRFPQVKAEELDDIEIEISVLTKPQPLAYSSPEDLLEKLIPFEHGVILTIGSRQSTFLPQVWEQLPDKVMFLEHLSMKAGMDANDWKRAEVKTYKAVHFAENLR